MGGMNPFGSMNQASHGSGFQASGVTQGQINTAYDQTQAGIKQQQDFVTALGGQNGLANQSSVFGQQQGLANQLQSVANGTGPNPALAQLNQQTGRNVSNQAALMAGQRGASQNVGLMARQAAQQGADTQQQAAGQGATLQAQQQLAAMQQLQGQQANMGNMANTQINQQQAGLTGLNQNSLQQQANLLGMQANVNSANAGIAGINAGGQQNMAGGLMGGIGGLLQNVPKMFSGMTGSGGGGGIGDMGNGFTNTGSTSAGPSGFLGFDSGASDSIGNMGGGAGEGLTGAIGAEGGLVEHLPKMAMGGNAFETLGQSTQMPTVDPVAVQTMSNPTGPQSNVGKMFDETGGVSAVSSPKVGSNSAALGSIGTLVPGQETTTEDGKTTTHAHVNTPEEQAKIDDTKDTAKAKADSAKGLSKAGSVVGSVFGPGGSTIGGKAIGPVTDILGGATKGFADFFRHLSEGGEVPALVSPGEKYLTPDKVNRVVKGADPMKEGETIPGKPRIGGATNDYENDTVKKDLHEGGIIIPRSITQGKDAEKKAHAFVSAILAKNGQMPKKAKK